MPGFTNMDPKHYLPFQPLCLSHDTISWADSQGSPSSWKHEGLCIIIYIQAPAETSGWTLTTPAVDVIFNSMLLSQQTDHLFIADNL